MSEKLDGDLRFEKIHFKPFSTLVLKNVTIIDKNPARNGDAKSPADTFFTAEYIAAEFTLKGLIGKNGIRIGKATVRNGQMNLVIEEDPNEPGESTNNLTRIFRIKKSEKKKSEKEIFHVRRVKLEGFRFTMKNYMSDKTRSYEGGIDWNDMDVMDIDIDAKGLGFKGGIMSGSLQNLSFNEKSGYRCESLSGRAKVGNGRTIVEDLHLRDPWSDVHIPLFMMSYSGIADFSDYIRKVVMTAMIGKSVADMRTIAYFAPQLKGNRLRLNVSSGEFHGTTDNFSIKALSFASAEGGFSATVNGRMTGIPEIDSTYIDASVTDFRTTSKGLGRFVSNWMKEGKLDLSRFAPGSTFGIKAHARGFLNRLDIDADIKSGTGRLSGDIRMENLVKKGKPIGMSGTLEATDLDIGKIAGTDLIGHVTLRTGIRASIGTGGSGTEAIIDSLNISRLNIYGYDYSRISGEGTLSGDAFDGRITCDDPNLNFLFHGRVSLSSKNKNAVYKFYANIGHADLKAMNIDKRGKSNIRLTTHADFRRTGKGDIFGEINLGDIVLENSAGKYKLGNVNLYSQTVNDTYRMRLKSDFAEGTYSASAPVTQFIKDLTNITLKQELPALFNNPEYSWDGNRYALDFTCRDTRGLLAFAMPGLYIAENTRLSARISEKGRFNAGLNSQRLAFGRQYMKDIEATFSNGDDSFRGQLTCNEIQAATLRLSDNAFRIFADDNHIGVGYSYDNRSELENRGEFIVRGELKRGQDDSIALGVDILPSTLYLNSREWRIQPSHLAFRSGEIDIESIEIVSGEQEVRAFGKASRTSRDTLTLDLNRFDISIVNPLLGSDFGISGAATGSAKLISPLDDKSFLVNMICDSTHIAGKPAGTVNALSEWDEQFQRFNISVHNELDGQRNIDASGTYTPSIRVLEAHAALNGLSVGYARPFLDDIFSEMDGSISGGISVEGPLDRLELSSKDARLNNGMLRIAFTNVPYFADGAFHIDRSGVYFDDIRIRDRFTGSGSVTGSINWDNFRDMSFDTRIKVSEIEGINLTEKQGESFYGNIFGTGNILISGPVNSLLMDIEAVTAKRGELHIPINSTATSGTSNLLKFTEIQQETYIDPYEEMLTGLEKKTKSSGDFRMNLHVNASPDVTAFVEIDKASGHVLSGNGNGTIDLEVSSDVFNINGDYTLTGGSYRFVALGLVRRDFTIQDGSTVNFNGDIFDSNLNIEAIYRTKASLSTLISDTTSVANRRTVECGIRITDKISNPRLAFSINIPDLDPTVKSRVESALSTEDKVQKQFLSLLLSNSFIPDEQSGIATNSTMLYSNVAEVMSNQLNNILQKLNIPVDLGLNYQPNERGNDVFDVAVSTQMFNNRVVVNGSVGNRQYNSGSTKADVVGDLEIEIKLDRAGAFRLNIFSHSADQYTNYLDDSQRNGVGLTYQTEFNKLGQFFRNMFSSKSKRQEAKRAEEQAIFEGSRIEMKITEDDNRKHERKNRKTVSDTVPAGGK
ncbi:MAG: translocation/assembly module TamB [Bacteroidales bacterium]|nr:translocation/assembly module TamB [Bacteroidales bacterium]